MFERESSRLLHWKTTEMKGSQDQYLDESSVNCSNTQKDAAMVAIYLHHLITERIDWRSIDHAVRSDRLEHFWDAVSQSAPNSFNSTGNSYTSNIELDRTGIRTLSAL